MSSAFAAVPCVDAGWYALKVRTGSEAFAATGLENHGYELFSPTQREKRKYSDRIVTLEKAMFPGYIFCKFDLASKTRVLSSPAVKYIVNIAGQPQTVSEYEIDSIRRMIDAGARSVPFLQVGQRVRVKYGALAGIEGLLTRKHSELELALSVDLLQRSVSVRIGIEQVQPI